MNLASPIPFAIACGLLLVTIIAAMMRRLALPRSATLCGAIGAMMLCLAAGGLTVRLPDARQAVVMVDLSPSTRTAAYRDASRRDARIRQLLGSVNYRIEKLADSASVDQTDFKPPKTDAIVLFSDGRFDLPTTAPPTYIVVDPNLEHPDDASITRLESRGQSVDAMIHNPGPPRDIQFSGTRNAPITAPNGEPVVSSHVDPESTTITARLIGTDPWPENDVLTIRPATRGPSQRWWIGSGPIPEFRDMQPQDLPTDPAAYLSTSLIVLNDIPADSITASQQQRLMQYVRDLGGGLVIVGGEHAFAAGGYTGGTLDTLSPLASAPSQAQRNWIILVDSSGSMATDVQGQTRWQIASSAAVQLLQRLPQSDIVSIGSFARDLRWWAQDRSAGYTAQRPLPPDGITPLGPTNLQLALQSIASHLNGTAVTEIILITDADATIDDPAALAGALRSVRARVSLLATADASRSPVTRLTTLTAGNVMIQPDPSLWTDTAQKLLRAAMPDRIERGATDVTFASELAKQPPHALSLWNRTWMKPQASELASSGQGSARLPLGAMWRLGVGQVGAFAFAASPAEVQAMADLVAQPPRDPRFKVAWSAAKQLTVSIDAVDGGRPMNDLEVQLALADESDTSGKSTTVRVPQTAPGRYEIAIPAPRTPTLATVRTAEHVIDRFAIAGRYAPEFDGIGNDHDAMKELASRSGGAVIEPGQTTPIEFHWPTRSVSLTSFLAAVGAAMIATGLLLWKRYA